MLNKKILYDLKKLLRKRAKVTKEQREYAEAEERAIMMIYAKNMSKEKHKNRK